MDYIDHIIQLFDDYSKDLILTGYFNSELEKIVAGYGQEIIVNREVLNERLVMIDCDKLDCFKMIFICSVSYFLTQNEKYIEKVLEQSIGNALLKPENKYFIFRQIDNIFFNEKTKHSLRIYDMLDDLYEDIYQSYVHRICIDDYSFIPVDERNKNLVVVLTPQYLTMSHAPSKQLLDYCYTLEEKMHKQILVINSAEVCPAYGGVWWFKPGIGNYIEDYNSQEFLSYKDRQFPFFQCPKEMPDAGVIKTLMDSVSSIRPYCIINLGGNSVTADMLAKIVPVIVFNIVISGRALNRCQFSAIGREADEDDIHWLNRREYTREHFIKYILTYVFKEQKHTYNRKELGLPEDKSIAIVVGGRLDNEVDNAFLGLVTRLGEIGVFTVFVGVYKNYDVLIKTSEALKKCTAYLGYQEDILAVNECCDLYINPKRKGGGSSAVEAMHKGLPVVTPDYGDVALEVGDEFCVKDYDEMYDRVMKLITDRNYYSLMSDHARIRADYLTDTERVIGEVIRQAEMRKGFQVSAGKD